MGKTSMPSLSPDGWVDAIENKADYLISHFFLSEFSQTHLYRGNVSSLPYLIQSNQGDPNSLVTKTKSTLESYFNRYFNQVLVEVSCNPNKDNPSKQDLTIFISFDDGNGGRFSVGKLAELLGSKIVQIATLNN